VLLQALRDTLDLLASNVFASAFGNSTNQDDYRWGRLHRLVFAHVLGGTRSIPPAAGFTDLDVGLPGLARDGAWGAINLTDVASLRAKRPEDFVRGYTAVVRWIAEPTPVAGDEDGLRAISSLRGGASEHVESPFYANRLARWLTGDYDDVLVTPAQIAPLPAENASAVAATSSQRRCVEEMNKRGAAVGEAQGQEAARCLERAAAGKLDDPQTCLTADAKGKVAKARDKANAGQASKCPERPVFAYAGADAAADAGAEAALALAQDLFGADLNAAVIAKKNDPVGAACQAELLKRAQKAVESIWTETRKTKKAAFAGKKRLAPANSATAVQEALATVFAPNAAVKKALRKITSAAKKKCRGSADLAAAVPGRCAGADVANVAGCVRGRVLCRACRSVNAMDALALPCDALDDGQVDAGCG
jgi:hypothetical protein